MANEKIICNQICNWNDPSDGCLKPQNIACPMSNAEPDMSGWGQVKEMRLIDANALQLEPDPWGGMNGVICVGRSGGKTMATVQAALKRMIDNAPTVDAVHAAGACYCGECKHWKKCESSLIGEVMCCTGQGSAYIQKGADDFCSRGERREGE